MTDAVQVSTERPSIAQWSATVFVALVPIHVLFVDIGFSLKPWFLPLVVGLVAGARSVLKGALELSRVVQVGVALMAVGGVLGVLNSADQVRSLRHLIALGIAVAVMLLIVSVKRIPYLGVAFRVGALIMVSATIIQALLVMPGWVSVETMKDGGTFVGQLAEVAYGDIILVAGAHGDSNFSALYAATWLFLVFAYPAERWFGRRADGIVVALLVIQLVLSLSKSGLLSLIVALLAVAVAFRVLRQWRNLRPAVAAGLIAFLGVSTVLLVTDATDGSHDIAHGLRKRGGQVLQEAEEGVVLATGGTVNADGRAAIWRRYTSDFLDNPFTGTGLGTPTVINQYAHSAPLEAAGGSGIFGLAGWLSVWGAVMVGLRRMVDRHPSILAVVGAVSVVFMASMFLSTNYEPIVALVFGLVLAPYLPTPVEPERVE